MDPPRGCRRLGRLLTLGLFVPFARLGFPRERNGIAGDMLITVEKDYLDMS